MVLQSCESMQADQDSTWGERVRACVYMLEKRTLFALMGAPVSQRVLCACVRGVRGVQNWWCEKRWHTHHKKQVCAHAASRLCSFKVGINNLSCASRKSLHVTQWSMATTSVVTASRDSTCEP